MARRNPNPTRKQQLDRENRRARKYTKQAADCLSRARFWAEARDREQLGSPEYELRVGYVTQWATLARSFARSARRAAQSAAHHRAMGAMERQYARRAVVTGAR